jgi:hypothetical protein
VENIGNLFGDNMNNIKFTVIYLDGEIEVIFGDEIQEKETYFQISVYGNRENDITYVTIPWAVIRKLIEE